MQLLACVRGRFCSAERNHSIPGVSAAASLVVILRQRSPRKDICTPWTSGEPRQSEPQSPDSLPTPGARHLHSASSPETHSPPQTLPDPSHYRAYRCRTRNPARIPSLPSETLFGCPLPDSRNGSLVSGPRAPANGVAAPPLPSADSPRPARHAGRGRPGGRGAPLSRRLPYSTSFSPPAASLRVPQLRGRAMWTSRWPAGRSRRILAGARVMRRLWG